MLPLRFVMGLTSTPNSNIEALIPGSFEYVHLRTGSLRVVKLNETTRVGSNPVRHKYTRNVHSQSP